MRFSVIHPGTQYAIRVAEQLSLHDQLHQFWTGVGFSKSSLGFRVANNFLPRLTRLLENRVSDILRPHQVRCLPKAELALLVRQYCHRAKSIHFLNRNEIFQRSIPERVFRDSDGVVGYDTSSWILASRCRKAGKPLILDQSIGHTRVKERIFQRLRRRYPDWSYSIPSVLHEADGNDEIEHDSAAVIVVPSTFVADTLVAEGIDPCKIVTIPFGTNVHFFSPPSRPRSTERLRFLFVGGISARKGVPDLIEAWNSADLLNSELWIAGFGEFPGSVKDRLPESIRVLGKLSRLEIASKMRQANALLFPSHFEGLAQVQVEALACGLPVIATHQSGASDLVVSNHNGYIVEAGNVEQLTELLRDLERNRDRLSQWESNIKRDGVDLSWQAYGKNWIREIPSRLG